MILFLSLSQGPPCLSLLLWRTVPDLVSHTKWTFPQQRSGLFLFVEINSLRLSWLCPVCFRALPSLKPNRIIRPVWTRQTATQFARPWRLRAGFSGTMMRSSWTFGLLSRPSPPAWQTSSLKVIWASPQALQLHQLQGWPPSCSVPFSVAAPCESHVLIPENYSGEAGRCSSFLFQSSLVFDLQPLTYPSDKSKIALMVKLIRTGSAMCHCCHWESNPRIPSLPVLLHEAQASVRPPSPGQWISIDAADPAPGGSAADYSIQFWILVAKRCWNDSAVVGV